ncbi:hypothetical protein ACFY8K_16795 [Streptomyces misionensis]|uniref:hypothetical protein n=1 Tax=Streptomyces misionensis TaxID=67331 RepID=UPI0036A15FE6
MAAYDATFTDKKTGRSVTKRVHSRQVAAAQRAALRSADGIVKWDYSNGRVMTVDYINRKAVYREIQSS